MKIKEQTSSYNDRRYGKPYIAKVDLTDKDSTPDWGEWIGQPGDDGVLVIEAAPGDVIMQGQKDHRKPRNSAPCYSIVQENGSLESCANKAEAYEHQSSANKAEPTNPLASYTDAQLIAEIARRNIKDAA